MKRIGIVGARKYTNRRKIKEFVYKLKEKFKDDVEIVSGGQPKGADGYAKKFALEGGSNGPTRKYNCTQASYGTGYSCKSK